MIVPLCLSSVRCSRARIGASAWHGEHHEANTLTTTIFPRKLARLSDRDDPRTGSAMWALGDGGLTPRLRALSREVFVPWLLTPNASSARMPTAPATIAPGMR